MPRPGGRRGRAAPGKCWTGSWANEAQPQLPGVVGEVVEHSEGVGVGPVQVVEQHEDRAPGAEHVEHSQEGLAEHDRRLDDRHVRAVPLGQQPAQRGTVGGEFWRLRRLPRRQAATSASATGR